MDDSEAGDFSATSTRDFEGLQHAMAVAGGSWWKLVEAGTSHTYTYNAKLENVV